MIQKTGAVITCILILLAVCMHTSDVHAAGYYARLLDYRGQVFVYRNVRRVPLKKGMPLREDYKIRTGADSYVDILFDMRREKVVRIEENSELLLKDLEGRTIEINLFEGSVLLHIEKIPKQSTFTIRTPISTSGARGTGWRVVTGKTQDTIEGHEGTVFIAGLDKDGNPIGEQTLAAGWKMMVGQFKEPGGLERLKEKEKERWQRWKQRVTKIPKKKSAKRLDNVGKKVEGGIDRAAEGKESVFETREADKISDKLDNQGGQQGGQKGYGAD